MIVIIAFSFLDIFQLTISAAGSYPKIPALKISRIYQSNQTAASGLCYWCSMATVQGYCLGSYTYGGVTNSYREVGKDYNYVSKSDAVSKKLNTYNGYANNATNLSSFPVKMSLISSGLGNNSTTYLKIYNQLKLGKPVIVYATAPHASVIIGYNGSSTTLDPAGFTVLEIKKDGTYWTNSASYYNKYANSPQIDKSASGSNMSCYVTLKSWLAKCGTITQICYPTNSMTYNIAYNANGGTGTMASRTITEGTTFTPSKCTFTKSGYYFAGYNVCRKSDSKWYVSGKGWLTNSEITNSGYTKAVYNNGTNYVFNGSWVNGVNPGETYTFYPIWKPNSTKLWFYPNYSGCNYVMGGGLDSRMSSYLYSRDTNIYTLSVDNSQRLNNQNSIKIVATSAGSSGHDMVISTSTNRGLSAGLTGDNRKMTLTFWAKSSVSGAKMYLRWGYNSTYKNVTLTNEWKKYSIDMTKNIYSGGSIHPYMDKAGTFWINSLTLCDGSNGTNNYTRYEDGYTIPNQVYNYGDTYNSLPTPVRDGYKFVGWYTQNEGGTQITTSTKVFDYDTNVYAHWEKEISNAPIEDIILQSGREYALYDNAVSWEKAKELCESAGGHLVTINSQEENDLIYEIVKDKNNFLWLGAKLNENTQQWEWITGEEFGYTNWDTGEPNSPSSEFYAQMYPAKLGFGNNAGFWNDNFGELSAWHSYFGFQNSMYICEFEPLYGDTDGDRKITITDATNIQKSIASLMDFSDEQTKYFDINNDGKKDITDVSFIQKIVAGIITAWRVSEY